MKRWISFSVLVVALAGWTLAQDRPVPTQQAAQKMTLPEGFQVTLFAGEPDIVQPIAMTLDDRGRLWVVECLSYPHWTKEKEGKDRVVILEDTNHDGQFDKKTIFYDKGANLSGIEYGFGGIWLCSTPNLIFIPDQNGDDKPDGPPEVLLDGWNLDKAKHNVFNALIWGPDGYLWGCNGIQSQSKVGKPGTPEKDRVEINCGVWRYHPVRKTFDVVAHGTTNPWGLDFDEYGEAFITNCVIKHLFHVIPGAHFDRMYGQDVNPHSYGLMPSIADYIHWGGGHWTTSRGNKQEHSDAGGGHAHSGAMIYVGNQWPKEYRNSLFTCNIHGNRLNRDILERSGSGYKSKQAKDFLFANDSWFRGIAVKQGPDDSMYICDWSDTGECHNYDKADQSNGRIYKVTYGKPMAFQQDLAKWTNKQLCEKQLSENDWLRRHARRILQERSLQEPVQERMLLLERSFQEKVPAQALNNMWTYFVTGEVQESDFQTWFSLNHPALRSWGVQLLANSPKMMQLLKDSPQVPAAWSQLQRLAASDKSEAVRVSLASALQKIPLDHRQAIAKQLVGHAKDANDPNIPLMIWYGIEPLVAKNPQAGLELLKSAQIPLLREYIARRLTHLGSDPISSLLRIAEQSKDPILQKDLLEGIQAALGGQKDVPDTFGWKEVSKTFVQSPSAEVRQRAYALGVMVNDAKVLSILRKTLSDPKADPNERILALRYLLRKPQNQDTPTLKALLEEKALRSHAIRALAAFNEADTPERLLKLYPTLTDSEKEDVIQTLASRASWSLALLDAMEANQVARKDVSVFVARQMQTLKDPKVGQRLEQVWGKVQPASQQRNALTKKYKELLSEAYLKTANLSNGRAVYSKNCASCHKLYEDGGDIGPALTGSQRANLDYILENVLDPNAVVAKEYQMQVIELLSGRSINGIVLKEEEKSITVQTQTEKLILAKEDIESRKQSNVSIMPEGILEKLTDTEVRDLIGYLQSKEQVPLASR